MASESRLLWLLATEITLDLPLALLIAAALFVGVLFIDIERRPILGVVLISAVVGLLFVGVVQAVA